MPRRRRKPGVTISLFPFLSVLACVIGTLTLMIAALAISQMASAMRPPEFDARAEAIATPTPTSFDDWVRRLTELSNQIGAAIADRDRLKMLQQRLAKHGVSRDLSDAELERAVRVREERQALEKRSRRITRQTKELGKAIEILEDEIEASSELPDDAPVALLPSGSRAPLTPYFIECLKGGVRLRGRNGTWSPELYLTDLVDKSRIRVYLERVRLTRSGTAIFLLRPDGVETYKRAEEIAKVALVRYGKLPIPGSGEIDFRLIESPGGGGKGGDGAKGTPGSEGKAGPEDAG